MFPWTGPVEKIECKMFFVCTVSRRHWLIVFLDRCSFGKSAMILQPSLSTRPRVRYMILTWLCWRIKDVIFCLFVFSVNFDKVSSGVFHSQHQTVSECRGTEDGEEKCNCWKVPNSNVHLGKPSIKKERNFVNDGIHKTYLFLQKLKMHYYELLIAFSRFRGGFQGIY